MTAELVGPIRTLRLPDGTRLTIETPQNTMDPRYMLCGGPHHVGCDCYEAHRNEDYNEYRLMHLAAHDAVQEVLAGHRTWPQSYAVTDTYWLGGRLVHEYDWDEGSCCSCTGCQIARKAYLR